MDHLNLYEWILTCLCGVALGVSKAGLKGSGILVIAVMALIFGAKVSTGIVLPMLIAGDILAVIYYNRHAQWTYVFKLMPMMILGVLLAVWVGKDLPDSAFKWGMAAIILFGVVSIFVWDKRKIEIIPSSALFAHIMGLLAGVATMIGNLAGAFANLYFLLMRLPKNAFIGTGAWIFFIINVFKLPFHYYHWNTVTNHSLLFNLKLLPFVVLGFGLGIWLIKMISEKTFRVVVLILTGLGAVVILF